MRLSLRWNNCIFVSFAEPTSAPVDLFVEDKNDTSVTIIWSQPENIGPTGLDGYTIEICKDGSKSHSALKPMQHGRGQIVLLIHHDRNVC